MPKTSLPGGKLQPLSDCYVAVPGYGIIYPKSLPDLSDSKSASYNDEPVIGRSFPIKSFSHSENRAFSLQFHFYVITTEDILKNIDDLRALQSVAYPQDQTSSGAPFEPPPVCRLRCGSLLSNGEICAILRSYSVRFPTDVPWDENTYLPYRFDVDTSWEAVYSSDDLPGQERILQLGG